MGKLTINGVFSTAIYSYVSLPEGKLENKSLTWKKAIWW